LAARRQKAVHATDAALLPEIRIFSWFLGAAAGPKNELGGPLLADSVEKVFLGCLSNFSGPLMRFTRGDVRDHTVLSKIDHGPPFWR
jgi:hypothetical protein